MDAYTAFQVADRKKHTEDSTFEDVVRYVQNKITTAATLGHRDTLCVIPIYLPDTPAFDRDAMTKAVMEHLTSKSFYCYLCPSCTLYVSWRNAVKADQMPSLVKPDAELLATGYL